MAIAEWSLAEGIELMAADLASVLFWDSAAYLGLVAAPVGWLIFVLQHTGRKGWLKPLNLLLASLVPATTLVLDWANGTHHLIYESFGLIRYDSWLFLEVSWGIWFIVFILYSYAMIALGVILLVRSSAQSQYRDIWQVVTLSFGAFLPVTAGIVDVSQIIPVTITPVACTLAALTIFLAVYHFRLFEIGRIAREAIFSGMIDPVIVLDNHEHLIDLNSAAQQMISCTREMARNNPVREVFSSAGIDTHTWPDNVSEVTVSRNGSRRHFEVNRSPIYDHAGKLSGSVSVFHDITERKQVEQALAKSEREHRRLIEIAREGIVVYDRNGRITLANPRFCESMGYAQQELVGKHVFALTDTRGLDTIQEKLGNRRRGISEEYETEFLRKTGTRLFVNLASTPIMDEGGEFVGGLVLVSDITQRKIMEARLAEAQRLAAIGQTSAIIGHHLRNPLQAVAAATYLLRSMLVSINPTRGSEAEELLSTLDDQVRYMGDIVSDLQDYSNPLKIETADVDVLDLIREVLATVVTHQDVEKSIVVRDDLSHVVADPRILSRILTNIVTNAVQAMPQGGNLTITGSKSAGMLTLSIRDDGEGIALENIEKVFKPFFTTNSRGLGLGLAVCKHFVDALGGKITVESQLGKGSCFTVTVPISMEESGAG
jgi:PAS domain S-box-containing protein